VVSLVISVNHFHFFLKVFSVNNSYLWNRYIAKRSNIAREMGEWVPEKRLFHGTTFADDIIRNGFDLRYANSESMFGKGKIFNYIF
jgi:hypothetical protein